MEEEEEGWKREETMEEKKTKNRGEISWVCFFSVQFT